MSNRQRKFRMEKLEARQMMAGDIVASVNAAGDLYLGEAPGQFGQDNTVAVSTLPNGRVHVLGGGVNQDFGVTGNVNINFGGGSDTVIFQADLTEPGIPNFRTHVDINVGASSTTDFYDNDRVEIIGTNVQGLLQIDTGAGTDWVGVTNTRVMGDGVLITTGAGQDTVDVSNSNLDALVIQTYTSLLEVDVDRVDIRGILDLHTIGTLRVGLGGGSDRFLLDGVYAGNIAIDAGAGNDIGTLKSVVVVDELMARMGEGSDTLSLSYVTADRLTADGGDGVGVDTLTTRGRLGSNTNAFRTSTISGWEWIDGLRPLNFNRNVVTPVRRTL